MTVIIFSDFNDSRFNYNQFLIFKLFIIFLRLFKCFYFYTIFNPQLYLNFKV